MLLSIDMTKPSTSNNEMNQLISKSETDTEQKEITDNKNNIASKEIPPFDNKDPESIVKKAEYDSAFAWIKTASETAYLIYSREMKEIPAKRESS